MNRAQDDYRIFSEIAGQRFSSPTVDAGDPRTDLAQKPGSDNLLLNPSFESGSEQLGDNRRRCHPHG